VRKLSTHLSYSPNEDSLPVRKKSRDLHRSATYCSNNGDSAAVTVFNCALNPALRKKKKMPSRSVPPPPPPAAAAATLTPFWKVPLPQQHPDHDDEEEEGEERGRGGIPREERTAGDGLSYSRTTSVDDIRQKLQEKREKQMEELRFVQQLNTGIVQKVAA
jgi:hypothetical protein